MDQDLHKLRVKRGSFKARLTTFNKFIDKCNSQDEQINFIDLKNRLSSVESLLNEFHAVQLEIEYLITDNELDNELKIREEFENEFYQTVARAESILEQNNINYRNQAQSDASSIASSNNNSNNSTHLSERYRAVNDNFASVKLPTINLPNFSGECSDWLQFKDTFDSLIVKNNKISSVEKFHYLKRALQGEAFEVIANIQVTNDNFSIAWNLLCEQFTDKKALLHVHIRALFSIEPIKRESSKGLSHLVDHIKMHLRSLEALGEPTSSWDSLIIFLILSKLDSVTVREWESKDISNEIPKLDDLLSFLKQKSKMLKKMDDKNTEALSAHFTKFPAPKTARDLKNKNSLNQKSFHTSFRTCPSCGASNHKIYKCSRFLKSTVSERINLVKRHDLCSNCLNFGHKPEKCEFGHCKMCSQKHNSLLHVANNSEVSQVDTNIQSTSTQQTLFSYVPTSKQVLLATVLIEVADAQGNRHNCRALLDPGSQTNFITSAFCQRLGLKTNRIDMSISGIFRVESKINSSCQIQLFSKHTPFKKRLLCLSVPEICDATPEVAIDKSSLSIPSCHKLADPEFHTPKAIDLLIGSDIFWEVLCIGQIKLHSTGPFLHKTKFGWVVAGPLLTNAFAEFTRSLCNLSQSCGIQDQLARFWEIEECPEKVYSQEERACEDLFTSTHYRDENGRFIVSIPLKESPNKLGDSELAARRRYFNLERKLQNNPGLRELYVSFMNEYENLGHMSRLERCDERVQFFLPHHGVLKEDSLTTKLRVVFDGSCPSSSGRSLNDIQMVGPTIQSDLFTILLRFRFFRFVVSADICKMYRQVLINPSQRHLQQIFWRSCPSDPLSIYQLNTVTYGTASASYLAVRAIVQLALENEDTHREASKILREDLYMDDLLTGSDSLSKLAILCREITSILRQGCFELRKWLSNEPQSLVHVTDSSVNLNTIQLGPKENTKTLGIYWSSVSDSLKYNIDQFKVQDRITKRVILSSISQIFDPLGILSPCIIVAKILLQRLWLEQLAWDESVPAGIHTQWVTFRQELGLLNDLQIPRHVRCIEPLRTELHTFSDASENAYGACVYIRTIARDGKIHVQLLCAKSRVAPLKSITVPRLELCGALIGAKLSQKIVSSSRCSFDRIVHWTDSSIVLGWIHMSSSSLKTFVANRISEIQTRTSPANWRHVNSASNPADLVSRGCKANILMSSSLWWHGPEWLSSDSSHWPESLCRPSELPDLKLSQVLQASVRNIIIDIERFSNFSRLQRSMAFCLRFIHNLKPGNSGLVGPLTLDELANSLQVLIKFIQAQHFSSELIQLSKGGQVSKCKIQSLSPFLDDKGVLRVGGRLHHSNLSFDKRHPILLPKHHFTKLLFIYEHRKLLHAGPNHLLSAIRETYWPISGRSIARKTVHDCIVCFKAKPISKTPFMGSLPKERVNQAPPFYSTGVDYAGYFILKDRRGRGYKTYKVWVCLFICLVTKAIHLEIAGDLSTNAFISCLRRFISRRGKPAHLFSDNGTNFTGAKNELETLSNFLKNNADEFASFCSNEGIAWSFIPAQSPHFGGLWEAGVKSMKSHLKRVMKNTLLVFEDFQTLLVQVEAILNSRPLSPMSPDPHDYNPITPGHFLIGRPLTSLPEPDLSKVPSNRLDLYQHIQMMRQHIWSRWSREYIAELQQRQRWCSSSEPNIRQGQLVLIKDSNTPPLSWPLARVINTHQGEDGVVRVVTIKSARGEYRRAVKNICPLPDMNDN